jgi:archaetidylinositol phosphate synthase
MSTTTYTEALRVQESVLAPLEKRCLIWMARHMPSWVNSDHLTILAGLAMAGVGLCYWQGSPAALLGAIVFLAVNWFGDSLDGTLARVRRHERPRYGFYVDHVLDAVGTMFIIAGLALGGHMTPLVAAALLAAYYLMTIEIGLATHAVGTFKISYWKFGPTELRILLAIGTLQLLRSPAVSMGGASFLLFDVGAVVGVLGLLATFIASAVAHTRTLYAAEPLPGVRQP